jgi:hypothetical protein
MPPPPAGSDTAPPPTTTKPLPSLSIALTNVVQRAADRATDGQRMYGPIAALWDKYLESDEVRSLPARLRSPLTALCADISNTANKHFDAFIKGSHPPRPTKENAATAATTTTTTSPLASNPPSSSPTYAQAAASTTTRGPASQPTNPRLARVVRPDTRLFVRLGIFHKARQAGAYALCVALKEGLGEQATLLKEVQRVNTGFALCTDSLEDLAALEKSIDIITRLIGECTIERQSKWTTYRLDNIPRTVNLLNGSCVISADYLTKSIAEATGQTPIRTTETSQSIQSNLYNTSWFVNFNSEPHTPIPRTLRILGVTATASLVSFKPKTIQCTRCFQWHNARSCTRAQRCRTCGSNNHSVENHTTSCITAKPHSCPARCIHCGGPHPADDLNCPLRRTHKGPLSKSQREDITKEQKAARTRACASANCQKANPNDIPMGESLFAPTPTTPTRTTSPAMPISTPATRFRPVELTNTPVTRPRLGESTNRFTPLFKEYKH